MNSYSDLEYETTELTEEDEGFNIDCSNSDVLPVEVEYGEGGLEPTTSASSRKGNNQNKNNNVQSKSIAHDLSIVSEYSSSANSQLVSSNSDANSPTTCFSPDYIINFIHRVKTVPYLYNPDNENFRNVAIKQATWKEISKEFQQPQTWCMKKWVSLRDYFVKRKKLIRMGKPARPWIYYNELKFLDIIYGPDRVDTSAESKSQSRESAYKSEDLVSYYGDSASNSISYDDGVEEEIYEEEINADVDEPKVQLYFEQLQCKNNSRSSGLIKERLSCPPSSSSQNENKRRRMEVIIQNEEVVNNIKNNCSGSRNKKILQHEDDQRGEDSLLSSNLEIQHDAYDLFCLSIAAHMRNMPKARAMQLQCKIMELMYSVEFPQYE